MKKKIPRRPSFKERVLSAVKKIPSGSTLTYGEVARLAGSPRAFRTVGSILKNNFDLSVPCHRVIRSDGKLGGYNRGGPGAKAELLLKERYFAGRGQS